MTKEATAKQSSDYGFDVSGMDCASCAGKIETAVKRIAGASQVKVGLQSQSLSVNLDAPEKVNEVANTVSKLGYGITQRTGNGSPKKPEEHKEGDGHEHSHPI